MATEQELERLIVRILGDGSHYQKILDQAIRQTEAAAARIAAESRIASEQNRLLQEAARLVESLKTPMERYRDIVTNLDKHLAAGRISQETYNRAMGEARKMLPEYQARVEALARAHQETSRRIREAEQAQIRVTQEAAAIYESTRNPLERYRATIQNLETHLKQGRIDQDTFNRAVSQAKVALDSTTPALRSFDQRLQEIGGRIRGFGAEFSLYVSAPIAAFGGVAFAAAVKMDSLMRGLTAVAGSAEEAERQLVNLREIAKLPGLGLAEAIQGSTNLQAAGLSAALAERALKGFGNALATVGRGKAELDGVIRALSQIIAKGKVHAEEINQIAERVPQIRKVMQEAFGTADTEVIQKMGLSAEQFITLVTRELEKLPPVVSGAQNSLENLGDAGFIALVKVGNAILELFMPAMDAATVAVTALGDAFVSLSKPVQTAIVVVGIIAASIGPLVLAIGTFIVIAGSMISAINTISLAFKTMAITSTIAQALTGPAGWAAIAAGLAVAAGAAYATKKMFDGVTESIENSRKAMPPGKKIEDEIIPIKSKADLEAEKAAEAEMRSLQSAVDSLTKSARTPFEVLEDKVITATKALKAGIIEMDTFMRIADDVAFDKLKLELDESKKRPEITAKAGDVAIRGTAEEFRARRGAVENSAEMARSARRREALAERHLEVLREIAAKVGAEKDPLVIKYLASL